MDPVSPSPREMKLKLFEFEVHFQGNSRPFLAEDNFCWVTNHVHLYWLVQELLYCTRSFSVSSRCDGGLKLLKNVFWRRKLEILQYLVDFGEIWSGSIGSMKVKFIAMQKTISFFLQETYSRVQYCTLKEY